MAKALSVNKRLKTLQLHGNYLGKAAIQQLIGSLLYNHTLKELDLPEVWEEFGSHCNGYEQDAKMPKTQLSFVTK